MGQRGRTGLLRDSRGGTALLWAAAMPAVAIVAVGAAELAALNTERGRLQDAADAAVLAGAQEISVGAKHGVAERAEALALAHLTKAGSRSTITASGALEHGGRALRLTLDSRRPSFFGDLLPPGGFRTRVVSVAQPMNQRPLCVLATQTSGDAIKVEGQSRIEATGCGIHSNRDLEVHSDARLTAGHIEVSGARQGSGMITPTALTGANTRPDPFADRSIAIPASCLTQTKKDQKVGENGSLTLAEGVHRGSVEASKNGRLTLAAGVHYFCDGDFVVKESASVTGDGVVLIFHKTSKLKIEGSARADLLGLKSGAWAGFLIVAARDHTALVDIKSVNARRLEGVIYLPAGRLQVDTVDPLLGVVQGDVSEAAKWTVVVAKELVVKGAPYLHINDDYANSPVPVPPGVITRGAKLSR